MTRPDCCRNPRGCPAHAAGQCDHRPREVVVDVDPELVPLLEVLYGDSWREVVANMPDPTRPEA